MTLPARTTLGLALAVVLWLLAIVALAWTIRASYTFPTDPPTLTTPAQPTERHPR